MANWFGLRKYAQDDEFFDYSAINYHILLNYGDKGITTGITEIVGILLEENYVRDGLTLSFYLPPLSSESTCLVGSRNHWKLLVLILCDV